MSKICLYTIIILLSLNFVGCSLIGLVIGANATDDRVFNTKHQEFALIDSAESITIITKANAAIEGEFISLSKIPSKKYLTNYNNFNKELNSDMINNQLPIISKINVRIKSVGSVNFDYSFPLEDIKEIIIKKSNYNWIVGLLAGAAMDAFIYSYVNQLNVIRWVFD